MASSVHDIEDHKEGDKSQTTGGSGDSNKMLRDHDNVIKNLRHELNQLKDHVAQHDKLHKDHNKDLDAHTHAIEECINILIFTHYSAKCIKR